MSEQPIVITRDELLTEWRAAHPGACSCPSTKIDSSCPQHGEIIGYEIGGKLYHPADVTIVRRGHG